MMNPITKLINTAQRMGLAHSFIFKQLRAPAAEHEPSFTGQFKLGEEMFPEEVGPNKLMVKWAAAEEKRGPLPEKKGKPGLLAGILKHCVSDLQQYARAHGEEAEFVITEPTGPPHARRYTYQVKIGARTFPRSSSSKKEARDTAVQAALAILIDEDKESETGPTSQPSTSSSSSTTNPPPPPSSSSSSPPPPSSPHTSGTKPPPPSSSSPPSRPPLPPSSPPSPPPHTTGTNPPPPPHNVTAQE